MRNSRYLLRLAVVTAMGLEVSAPLAMAQDQLLEEVVVTAQRREQALTDVPISLTAFSASDLERGNIGEARDYLAITPNVAFTDDGGTGSRSINISIRGVGNVSLGEVSTANSIGYYIDELNVGSVSNGTINPELQDMARIEVLRGPQGTYFGRNALGGAINITTNLPSEEFYSEFSASAGNYGTYGGEAIVNVPLTDRFMVRGMYAYNESDTWVENTHGPGSELGYEHHNARIALRALPTDRLTVDFSLAYTDEEEGGDLSVATGVLNLDTQSIFGADFQAIDEEGFFPDNDDKVSRDLDEINNNEFTIANLRLAYDFDNVMLRSVTGWVDSSTDRDADLDNTSLDTLRRFNRYGGESFSQELRLQSTGAGDLDWTVGVFYAEDEIEQFNSIQAGAQGSYVDPATGMEVPLLPPIPAGFRINENNRVFETSSLAVFGDMVWRFASQWDLTLGARYTRDEIDNKSFDVVAFEGAVPDSQADDSFTDFSPRVVLAYHPQEATNIYGSLTKGYKAGGVDFLTEGATSSFDPEELLSYELGFKTELAGGKIRLGGAAFYLDWDDMQVQTNYLADPDDISSAVERTLNAAKANGKGVEFEVQGVLASGLTGALNLGYLDIEFDEFPNAIIKGSVTPVDLGGQVLPRSPKISASATLEYSFDLSDQLSAYVRGQWMYRDQSEGNLEAVAAKAGYLSLPAFPYEVDAYDVVNLGFGVEGRSFRVNAFVQNLFDEEYYTGTGDGFGLAGIKVKSHPTQYGVKFTWFTGS
ncbi:TonB-dependent receptor domain-containing protein [Parahaliea mediterranea]|uniref:TonB-dependent receptor n=1 Tax=Parahaliea mediterranea TaxID=651086 RepID=A0A939IKT3_9GAMM|nr:TonB-dependent receptor [Parahaliea mediterranea]